MTKPGDMDGFFRIAERVERERNAARDSIEKLIGTIDESSVRKIPSEWHTLGFVTELAATSLRILEQNRRAAVGLAQLGLVVLGLLRDDQYPSPLLPQATVRRGRLRPRPRPNTNRQQQGLLSREC